MTNLFLVARVPCDGKGRLHEPIGVCLTEETAVAMCTTPQDCVIELEAGKSYPVGFEISGGVRCRLPLCPSGTGWRTAKGLAFAE